MKKAELWKKKDAIDFVNKNNLQGYAECSAKNNENIKETFEKFYKILYNKNKNKIKEKKMKLELIDKKKNDNKKDFCCQWNIHLYL